MPARTKKKSKKVAKKAHSGRAAVRARAGRSRPSPKRKAPAKRPARKASKPAKSRRPAPKRPAKRPSRKAPQAAGREREQLRKARERAQRERERERERAQREKERERAQREKERERAQREKERAREQKERERERVRKEREQAAQKVQREKAREAERKAREAERQRQRDEARRLKEEERAAREAEREAYRKAKEAERERLRAEREAARRALEGRVARATKRAQRASGGRTSTTRVYRPDAIPNQAGTRRQLPPGEEQAALRRPPPPPPPPPAPAPPPPPKEAPPEAIEDRYASIVKRLGDCDDSFRNEYTESFDMSWIYHDSALEGVVYTYQELKTAIDPGVTVVPDSSLQPVCDEIRRHKHALELVRELGEKKRVPITVDTVKKIYLTLHPEEGDLKSVKYRKDIPQHRLYFHEYAPPDKIAYKVRQVIDWLNGPEPKKIKNPIRIASRVHFDLLRVFPFPNDSGKVARLLANVILLRSGHPPAIIHSTERQRYYEALKSSLPTIIQMVTESINNGLMSIEKRLDEQETRVRAFTG